MTLEKITTIANNSTDENFSTTLVQEFFNEGIAQINIEVSTSLPYITTETAEDDYSALDEKWIRGILIPYVCYLIKVNDGSLNEAGSIFFQRYQRGLIQLKKMKTTIKPEYRLLAGC